MDVTGKVEQMFCTPVLLILFNRPEHTRRVLLEVARIKPRNLYIFQDGPRNDDDKRQIALVRDVLGQVITWQCNIRTNFQTENLGCGKGPSSAISWFFNNVDDGIIMEDDAVPHQDFFPFAEQMLEKYRDNSEIYAVGSMRIDPKRYGDASYYFSMMNRCLCAWATWKRAWEVFDYDLKFVSRDALDAALKTYHVNRRLRECWCDRLDIIHKNHANESSWDMQFLISIWLHHGKGIFPNYTLSSNIGFDNTATHLSDPQNIAANRVLESIMPIRHPKNQKIITKADIRHDMLYTEPYNYGINGLRLLPMRINKRIKRFLHVSGSWKSIITNMLCQ